jgi:putative transposase
MSTPRYRKNAGAVYNLHYHFVWCPKYRKSVLVGAVEDALRQLLTEKAPALDVEIEALEIMPDHVHLFVSAPPTQAPQHLANQFKGYTSRVLRQRFAHLRTRLAFPVEQKLLRGQCWCRHGRDGQAVRGFAEDEGS